MQPEPHAAGPSRMQVRWLHAFAGFVAAVAIVFGPVWSLPRVDSASQPAAATAAPSKAVTSVSTTTKAATQAPAPKTATTNTTTSKTSADAQTSSSAKPVATPKKVSDSSSTTT